MEYGGGGRPNLQKKITWAWIFSQTTRMSRMMMMFLFYPLIIYCMMKLLTLYVKLLFILINWLALINKIRKLNNLIKFLHTLHKKDSRFFITNFAVKLSYMVFFTVQPTHKTENGTLNIGHTPK